MSAFRWHVLSRMAATVPWSPLLPPSSSCRQLWAPHQQATVLAHSGQFRWYRPLHRGAHAQSQVEPLMATGYSSVYKETKVQNRSVKPT